MANFFINVILSSLFCVGVNILTREGLIFGWWQKAIRADDGLARFTLAAPLSECLVCMSSFYGVATFGFFEGCSGKAAFIFWPIGLFLFALSLIESTTDLQKEEIRFSVKWMYLFTILLFCITQYEKRAGEAFFFIICLAGINRFADLIISSLKSDIEYTSVMAENSIDQAEAVETIISAINKK